MKAFVVSFVVLLCLLVSETSLALKFGNRKKKSEPRRRLMEEIPEVSKNCNAEIEQTWATANQAKAVVETQLQEALAAQQAAQDKIVQLEALLQESQAQLASAAKNQNLEAELKAQQESSQQLLEETKAEAKRIMVDEVTSIKEKLDQTQAQAKAALAEKDEVILKIKQQNKQLEESETFLKKALKENEEEIEHWRLTFSNRTYCNMTHIGNDIYETSYLAYNQTAAAANVAVTKTAEAATIAATKTAEAATIAATKTAEAATVAATQLNYHGQKIAREMSVQAEYGYQKSKEVYDEQYKQHWPKVKPHYDKHVLPLVQQFTAWKNKQVDPHLDTMHKAFLEFKTNEVDPRLKALNKERKRRFAQLAEIYGRECMAAYKNGSQIALERDWMEAFQKVGPGLKASCEQPELSVTLILRVLLVAILLPFAGRILGRIWSVLGFLWNVFMTVTLLRFIFPKKTKTQKTVETPKVPSNKIAQ